jgi:SnoaL-like domain
VTDDSPLKPIEILFRLLSGDVEVLNRESDEGTVFAQMFQAIADDFVLHVQSGIDEFCGDFSGLDGIAEYSRLVLSRVKTIDNVVDTIASDDNFVIGLVRSTLEGSNGNPVQISLCTLSRICDGKLAEAWQFSSSLNNPDGIRQELGLHL